MTTCECWHTRCRDCTSFEVPKTKHGGLDKIPEENEEESDGGGRRKGAALGSKQGWQDSMEASGVVERGSETKLNTDTEGTMSRALDREQQTMDREQADMRRQAELAEERNWLFEKLRNAGYRWEAMP